MKISHRGLRPTLFLAAWIAFGATASIDPNVYLGEIKFLASQEMRGRATGSPELEKAADFIAGKFREFGLQPVVGTSYLQAFPVTTSGKLGPANRFSFAAPDRAMSVPLAADFMPFSFSASAHVTGGVVFAGYGITAPEYHYDDYEGVDVKGRIVLLLRHEPQENDDHSVFAGRSLTKHAQFAAKATNAKMHGAAAVILINDIAAHPGDPDDLQKFGNVEGPSESGIPFLQVKEQLIDPWFKDAGKSLQEIEAGIDKDLKPESFAFPSTLRVDATVDIQRVVKTVHNVAAYLPGQTSEYVVIGAHYDHLGLGEQYSMAPDQAGTIHPGADDNASGTAGVIELARWFSKEPKQKRGILFLSFAGEEMGLLGSEWYVEHPEKPLANAVAMINLDMIGRVRNAKVYIGGVETGTGMRAMLDGITPKYQMNLDYSDTSGYGSSDHTSFTTKQVPVLFFFSGLHSDYHKPSDTWDKIDAPGAVKVLQVVADAAASLRDAPSRPQFVRVAPSHGEGAGPLSSSSGSGYGPYFGSIPDFGEGTNGVKFADVREGSPASKAGFKAGDVMVEFDGKPIQNLYDFTYALQAKKPGDEVLVKVQRNGATVEAKVLLTKRQ
ncbi:Peptidase M28 [Candidatus Sulfopaludibacter sp. SbA3]|nr:Peptidase M28 [Candidatus Sulfopaludibacter sp. SbA3]